VTNYGSPYDYTNVSMQQEHTVNEYYTYHYTMLLCNNLSTVICNNH